MTSTAIRSTSDAMVLSRMFGHVNPDTYSPTEYAQTLGPVLESHLRQSPVKIANNQLSPHNRGVSLTLVFERTYSVRPGGKEPNTVLCEHGCASQQDFNKFVGGLFEMADKLTDVTLVDALGNSHTFQRGSVPQSPKPLSEDSPLDLSPLTEGGTLRPFERSGSSLDEKKPLIAETIQARDVSDAVELVKSNGYVAPITVQSKGPSFWRILATRTPSASMDGAKADMTKEVRGLQSIEAFALDGRSDAFVLIGGPARGSSWTLDTEMSESKNTKITEQLDYDMARFIGETADWVGAAGKLLTASENDPQQHNQEGLGYRAYLRQVITKKDPSYLTKSEDKAIKTGALKARKDLIRLAGTMQAESTGLKEGMYASVVPAYGRDYDNAEDAVADFHAGKDFILMDISSPWDGKPGNKPQFKEVGYKQINIRYNQRRDVVVVDL